MADKSNSAPPSPAENTFQSTVEEQSFFKSFWSQLVIMMRRNTILQYRYLNATVAQVFISPLIFSLLIFILQAADHANQSISNPHPPLSSLNGVQRCQGRNPGDPCVSIFYTTPAAGTVNYAAIMSTFARKNSERTGFTFDTSAPLMTDVTVAPSGVMDIVPVPNADFIYSYALRHPNTTAWGITFNQEGTGPAINLQYQLWFNATNTANGSDIFGRTVLSFVRGLDEAIITILNDPAATVQADIDVNIKDWPLIPPQVLSDSIVQQLGPGNIY
jgi:hypothetical protein